ncbi:MAG: HetZ-related protein 2 [Symploca sp. SIO2C1]|nr:HetZ-related protein 2 [Symploca sp. SIO2C1]
MQTLTVEQGFEERNFMEKLADLLEKDWKSRLLSDYPDQSPTTRNSIIRWLLGENLERFDSLTLSELAIAKQAMDYRYRILRQRYLGVGPERAYQNLMTRLISLVTLRNKIRTWIALSRDRQRAVVDVLQEVIQELLNSDRYIQKQITWIAQCTQDSRLRDTLLLTTIEEYCLRPIRNQPLLVYRFVNFLRRSQRSGMTNVPGGSRVHLLSESLNLDDSNEPVSLLDNQAQIEYQQQQNIEEQRRLRNSVSQEFEVYLSKHLGTDAVKWLQLYLQGKTQEAIARTLNKPVKEVYRLREKISYHAVRVFAVKEKQELVANWLETSLHEHTLGLTPSQLQEFLDNLTPQQRQIFELLKTGQTKEAIAQGLKLKTNQVMGEWSKLYLAAQAIRTD